MNLDFTGERIIPGKVDPNLYHEHFVRYLFARRLAAGRQCLDLGCGVGYGAMELARAGATVAGVDIAFEAVAEASRTVTTHGVSWYQASVTALPFRDESFNLVTAFEVIEHVENWHDLLQEASRVLMPGGIFVVSTPNRAAYAELRGSAGINPFHVHEFDPNDFQQALRHVFPHVEICCQWSAEINMIAPAAFSEVELESDGRPVAAEDAVFLLAVCGKQPLYPVRAAFAHLPDQGNLLLERLRHIRRLEGEITQKNVWLREAQAAHATLLDQHRSVLQELHQSNEWASKLDQDLRAAGTRILALQDEVEELARIGPELERQTAELARCVDVLHHTEAQLDERTAWAQALDSEVTELRAMLDYARSSRWVKLGRRLNLGPRLP